MGLTYKHIISAVTGSLLLTGATSCVTENLDACPNDYYAAFRFDMNIHDVDAFAKEVGSVDLYCFDHNDGRLVYKAHDHSDALAAEGYRMRLDIEPGTYDIIVWGGMHENTSFTSLPSSPEAIHELALSIASGAESTSQLTALWHSARTVTFTDNNVTGTLDPQVATFSLVKNTNRVNIYLVRLDGTELNERDFTVRLSSANARMAHDNAVSGNILYSPWAVDILHDYETEANNLGALTSRDMTVTTPTAHRSELSVGRLMADARSRLEVIRNSDGKTIAALPLEPNILLYRQEFFASMDEQEYLDRIDSADITFVLSDDNGWDVTSRILINKWAVLPIQYVDW